MSHLKILRLKAKIKTAKKAAKLLKISASMVYKLESGVKKPSFQIAIKMTKLYKCTLEEIFLPYNTTDSDDIENII